MRRLRPTDHRKCLRIRLALAEDSYDLDGLLPLALGRMIDEEGLEIVGMDQSANCAESHQQQQEADGHDHGDAG